MQHGKILYRYTIKDNKFFIHEGVVNHTGFRPLVNFKDGGPALRCPREEDLGKVKSVGRSVWLEERDDNKARAIFIEYELDKIDNLKSQIDKKLKFIEVLRADMEEPDAT